MVVTRENDALATSWHFDLYHDMNQYVMILIKISHPRVILLDNLINLYWQESIYHHKIQFVMISFNVSRRNASCTDTNMNIQFVRGRGHWVAQLLAILTKKNHASCHNEPISMCISKCSKLWHTTRTVKPRETVISWLALVASLVDCWLWIRFKCCHTYCHKE